jgi:hypothetical protein
MTAPMHSPDSSTAPGNGQRHAALPAESQGGGRTPLLSVPGQAAALAAQGRGKG